jgi:hypothetical protein
MGLELWKICNNTLSPVQLVGFLAPEDVLNAVSVLVNVLQNRVHVENMACIVSLHVVDVEALIAKM